MTGAPSGMTVIPGGTPAHVPGVSAGGMSCGIKESGRSDLALFRFDPEAAAAGFFTRNRLQGVHVPLDKERLKKSGGKVSALLINSGVANCSTGREGVAGAERALRELAGRIGVAPEKTLIGSTGVIGRQVPFDKAIAAYPKLIEGCTADARGGEAAARAIMTTDTRPKSLCVEYRAGKKTVRVGGCAKGSGMIAPNMATMFGFVFTDAVLSPAELKRVLRECVDRSFNSVTVDGDTSPNDMVLAFATGLSGVRSGKTGSRENVLFRKAAAHVCDRLAEELALDGEGATKLVRVRVTGAPDEKRAKAMALRIANSPLVKTAMHGSDPNWGRIVTAAGACDGFDPAKAALKLNGCKVYEKGRPLPCPPDLLAGRDIEILLQCGTGKAGWTVRTCDFSKEYVSINADYTT